MQYASFDLSGLNNDRLNSAIEGAKSWFGQPIGIVNIEP